MYIVCLLDVYIICVDNAYIFIRYICLMEHIERQRLLNEIRQYYNGPEIISIIFADKEEICQEDYKKINHEILQMVKNKKAIIIYHGSNGGETNAGFGLAVALRTKFDKQLLFFLPEKACSAHVLPIFLSNGLWLSESAYLTPVDPSIYHYSKNYPCCRILANKEHKLYGKAKKVFDNTANMVFEILKHEGSLIIDPNRLDFKTEERIINHFLNPKQHNIQIKYMDLRRMNFEVNLADENDEIWKLVRKVHTLSFLELADKKKRYLVETYNKSLIC